MRDAILWRALQISFLLMLSYAAMIGWGYLQRPNFMPIETVHIEGSYQHVSKHELKALLTAYFPANFFDLDLSNIKQRLLENPWVDSVSISRQWPETLKISINERQAVARWGSTGLINNKGDIFFPISATIPTNLPVLSGPQNQATEILEEYRQFSEILLKKRFYIANLQLADSWAWKLQLTNGLVILLGSKDPVKRIKRFLEVYDTVFPANKPVAQVDLRYLHGMAVQWKQS